MKREIVCASSVSLSCTRLRSSLTFACWTRVIRRQLSQLIYVGLDLGDGVMIRSEIFWISGIEEAALAGFSIFKQAILLRVNSNVICRVCETQV